MEWVISAAGAGLVLAALRDVFHTLWHPAGRGDLSAWVTSALWRASRRTPVGGRMATLAGPLAMVAVAGLWTVLIVLGWTLVYWPHISHGFSYAQGLEPTVRADFLDALYLSLVMVATLGLGDIVPADGWLRIIAPLQALVGFALLTALVTWISQVYPALTRRRVLALRLASLRNATRSVGQLPPTLAVDLMTSLAVDMAQTRVDLGQRAETYYFHEGEDRSSLAAMIGFAADLAVQGQASPRADLRVSAAMLSYALQDVAVTLNQQFLHLGNATPMQIFDAYAIDHGRSLVRA